MKNTNLDAIVILGGSLKKDKGRWRTTYYGEKGDKFGVQGDRLRVVAASYLHQENPKMIIIVSGGKGQLKGIEDAETISVVIKRELVELGVSEKNIIEEDTSGNTFEQLREIGRIIGEMKAREIGIISNAWHFPRIRAMIENFQELNLFVDMLANESLKFISAEEVCLAHEKEKWEAIIKTAYKSDAMKKRMALERKGIQDIKKGVYKL